MIISRLFGTCIITMITIAWIVPPPLVSAAEPPSDGIPSSALPGPSLEPAPELPEAEPQPTEPDAETLYLRDGSFVRGEVIERVDGSHIVIELAGTGEQRTIPWARLDIEPAKKEADAAPEAKSKHIHVEIELVAPNPDRYLVSLEEVTGRVLQVEMDYANDRMRRRGGLMTETLCISPCNKKIKRPKNPTVILNTYPSTAPARFKAMQSKQFSIGGYGDEVHIKVRPGRFRFMTGGFFMGLSGLGVLVAAIFVGQHSRPGGIVTAIGGAGLVGGGITLIALSPTKILGIR